MEYIGVGYRDDDSAVEDTAAGCYIVQQYIGGGTLKQKILSRVGTLFHFLLPCLTCQQSNVLELTETSNAAAWHVDRVHAASVFSPVACRLPRHSMCGLV